MNNSPFKYRIYYEDTDAGGVVYYANYLKFFERARTDFLRSLGVNQSELKQKYGVIFVVKECLVKYAQPAKLDDEISVSAQIAKVGKASIIFHQQICDEKDNSLCSLEAKIACIDAINFKPIKLPQNLYLNFSINKFGNLFSDKKQ
jgi:acyl-CoA thioester hydrolase